MRGVGERIRKPVGQIKLTYSTERRRKGDRMDERGREKERNDREGERWGIEKNIYRILVVLVNHVEM
jgi:hypothetical protein